MAYMYVVSHMGNMWIGPWEIFPNMWTVPLTLIRGPRKTLIAAQIVIIGISEPMF